MPRPAPHHAGRTVPSRHAIGLALACAALTLPVAAQYGGGRKESSTPPSPTTPANPVEPRWLDRLDRVDRAAVDAAIGYAAPAFTTDLIWSGTEPLTWESLRGKVVVLQSWTSASSGARSAPRRLESILREVADPSLVLLALHTPDGAEKAEEFLARAKLPMPTIVDPSGAFCDALGVYERPVNILVDRQGTVRFAGLNPNGLREATAALLAEPFDAEAERRERTAPPAPATVPFPEPMGSVRGAGDLRGRTAPPFVIDRWLTDQPTPGQRLILIDFWATWCGPCMATVPHMNELATRYRQDICVVGVTDESKSQVEQGLLRRNRKQSDFHYALASDPDARLSKAYQVAAIPHCVLISGDNVVRWQGMPTELTPTLLDQFVAANRSLATAPAGGGGPPPRWRTR